MRKQRKTIDSSDVFELGGDQLAILPIDEIEAVADQVHDADPPFGLRHDPVHSVEKFVASCRSAALLGGLNHRRSNVLLCWKILHARIY